LYKNTQLTTTEAKNTLAATVLRDAKNYPLMYIMVHKKWNMYAEICALLVMVFSLKITEAKALIFFAIRLIFKIFVATVFIMQLINTIQIKMRPSTF